MLKSHKHTSHCCKPCILNSLDSLKVLFETDIFQKGSTAGMGNIKREKDTGIVNSTISKSILFMLS